MTLENEVKEGQLIRKEKSVNGKLDHPREIQVGDMLYEVCSKGNWNFAFLEIIFFTRYIYQHRERLHDCDSAIFHSHFSHFC